MIRNLTFLIFFFLTGSYLKAQTTTETSQTHKELYENAYIEIKGMLENRRPTSFKKAVFLMEHAFLNDTSTYEKFDRQVLSITNKLKELIKKRKLEGYKTAGNWAAFTYMIDSLLENNFKPYSYDFDKFLPDKDPTVGFVIKLLRTGKGNCVSLPFLYKILVEEIGARASLALAPLHCYIKHRDEAGKWINIELTNGSFSRDEWIMQETGVTAEQIKSGIYMNALTDKQSLALIMENLANNYRFQFGNSPFDLQACETGLKYFPNSVNLLATKFEHYRIILLKARRDKNKRTEDEANKILYNIDQKLAALAYKQPTSEDYENWVKENEIGRQSTASKSH